MIAEKPLQICNASAGSGKTYTLVIEFLKLVLNEKKPDDYFSRICAMTFTNKAAIEMKDRIIKALNDLAYPIDKKQKKYQNEVSEKLNLSVTFIQEKAKKVLTQLLHQYEQFHILTIDKFNLRLIRSFARDLNLNSDFQTTTDDKEVLSEIIDELFSEIKNDSNDEWSTQALEYAKENLEHEEKWDFKARLKEVAEILVKESNFSLIEELKKMDFSQEKYKEIKKNIQQIKSLISNEATNLKKAFDDLNINENDLPGKSRTVNAFNKLLTNDLFFQTENRNFFTSNVFDTVTLNKKNSFPDLFITQFENFTTFYSTKINEYHNLNEFRKVYYLFTFLNRIAIELDLYKNKNHNVLISEFNKLIAELIQEEEAPYIYERIGNRYNHFLLDEFQDTSRLQWTNLIPLIHDSIANKNNNFIVGDPKQSIYRFKNGLAEQFISLPAIYNPENNKKTVELSKYFYLQGEKTELNDNYRSSNEIVSFNNYFFTFIKDNEPSLLKNFYEKIEQNVIQKQIKGVVYFHSEKLEKSKNKSIELSLTENENDINDMSFLLEWIDDCLKDGYKPGDICILGYTAIQCNTYANFLYEKGFEVVSADSLLIFKNPTVLLLLSYLKCIAYPHSKIELMVFAEKYLTLNGIFTYETWSKYCEVNSKKQTLFNSELFIKDYFNEEKNFYPSYTNLYHLIQHFYQITDLDELSNPYLHQFSDYVFQYEQNFSSHIRSLLEDFEKNKKKISLQIADNEEAIKVLTVHKSKGLEFPVVLIPSLHWEIMKSAKYLFHKTPYIYYSNLSARNKVWNHNKEEYETEFQKNFLDKINLMYVAFTRPKHRLYVRNVINTESINYLSHHVNNWFSNINHPNKNENLLLIGDRTTIQQEIKEKTNIFTPKNHKDRLWYPQLSFNDKQNIEEEELSEERHYGTLLHYLLSNTTKEQEIEKTIHFFQNNGMIETKFVSKLTLDLKTFFSQEICLNIFSEYKEIYRERKIICSDGTIIRPDLIVIKENELIIVDYKTGTKKKEHQEQILLYKKALNEMKFPKVKSFLYYTSSQEWLEM
ncbi:MAG: UvrD-helicase domain-containing protein [Flavobacteriia bacterium]|nr:UvrD-helicase domain-containing protein [Flavobacteriia bacterium]